MHKTTAILLLPSNLSQKRRQEGEVEKEWVKKRKKKKKDCGGKR